jgi:hypothetical protein
MAKKNRTEAKSQVTTEIVPTVTNTTHRNLLNNDLLESIRFRKEVEATATPSGGAVTCDYTNADLVTVTLPSGSLTVSFTGLEKGDRCFLYISKPLSSSISFSGATDVTEDPTVINTLLGQVLYSVYSSNGFVFVKAFVSTMIKAQNAFFAAASAYYDISYVTPKKYVDNFENEFDKYFTDNFENSFPSSFNNAFNTASASTNTTLTYETNYNAVAGRIYKTFDNYYYMDMVGERFNSNLSVISSLTILLASFTPSSFYPKAGRIVPLSAFIVRSGNIRYQTSMQMDENGDIYVILTESLLIGDRIVCQGAYYLP